MRKYEGIKPYWCMYSLVRCALGVWHNVDIKALKGVCPKKYKNEMLLSLDLDLIAIQNLYGYLCFINPTSDTNVVKVSTKSRMFIGCFM